MTGVHSKKRAEETDQASRCNRVASSLWKRLTSHKNSLGFIGHAEPDDLALLSSKKCWKIQLRPSICHHSKLEIPMGMKWSTPFIQEEVNHFTREEHRQYQSTQASKWSKDCIFLDTNSIKMAWRLWSPRSINACYAYANFKSKNGESLHGLPHLVYS